MDTPTVVRRSSVSANRRWQACLALVLAACFVCLAGCDRATQGPTEVAEDVSAPTRLEAAVESFSEALGLQDDAILSTSPTERDGELRLRLYLTDSDFDRRGLFRALLAAEEYASDDQVIELSVTYPQRDGTGRYLGIVWNRTAKATLIWDEQVDPQQILVIHGFKERPSPDGILWGYSMVLLEHMSRDAIQAIADAKSALPDLGESEDMLSWPPPQVTAP